MAKAELRELGIAEEDLAAVADWYAQRTGLPSLDETNSKAGALWAAAARRYVFSTIQENARENKPQFASTSYGRVVYGLTSFLFTFTRNVHQRALNRSMRDYGLRRDAGQNKALAATIAFGGNATYFVTGMMAITAGQLVTSILREALFNGAEWDRREKEGTLEEWLVQLAFARAGWLGVLDVPFQGYLGIRYQRDLTALTAGPYLSVPLSALQAMANLALRNSPKTNNAEYAAIKEGYRAVAAPALAAGLSAMPGGPLLGTLLGAGIMVGTSNVAADAAATAVVGRKDSAVERDRRALRPVRE